jgi:hypothetical protein
MQIQELNNVCEQGFTTLLSAHSHQAKEERVELNTFIVKVYI